MHASWNRPCQSDRTPRAWSAQRLLSGLLFILLGMSAHAASPTVRFIQPVPAASYLISGLANGIEIHAEATATSGSVTYLWVTVLYLQFSQPDQASTDLCGYDDWPESTVWLPFVKSTFTNSVNEAWIYPYSEFSTTDSYSWPSYQELMRRGYHYVVILNTRVIAWTYDTLFFGETNPDPEAALVANDVLPVTTVLLMVWTWNFSSVLGAHRLADSYLVRNWTTGDGLSDNSVRAIVETQDGYLWIGTANGLARFDAARSGGPPMAMSGSAPPPGTTCFAGAKANSSS